jgi:hypothetical protein
VSGLFFIPDDTLGKYVCNSIIKQEEKIIHNENHTMMKFRDWPGLNRKKGATAAVFVFHILCKNKNFFECVGDSNHTSFPNLAYCNCPFSL